MPARESSENLLYLSWVASVFVFALAPLLLILEIRIPTGVDWPAWVQAIGSLIAIGIAIAIPAWQHTRDLRRVHVEEEGHFLLALEMAEVFANTMDTTRGKYLGAQGMTTRDHAHNLQRLNRLCAAVGSLPLHGIKPSRAAAEFFLAQTTMWRAERRLSIAEAPLSLDECQQIAAGLQHDCLLCQVRVEKMIAANPGITYETTSPWLREALGLPPLPPREVPISEKSPPAKKRAGKPSASKAKPTPRVVGVK